MRTKSPGWRFVICNSLHSMTVQYSSPARRARVTARSQGSEPRSRNGEGAASQVRMVRCAILTPGF